MNVLVACEESQRVCAAFREKGHKAFSCDLVECSGGHPEWHIQTDVLSIINGYCKFFTCDKVEHIIDKEWDLIIAFPPCTYLSKAGACRLYHPAGIIDNSRYELGLEAKDFFLKILNANCSHICIENPIQLKIFDMPKYSQQIEPYMFGHPFKKCTRLWLKGLPLLKPTTIVEPIQTFLPSNTSKNTTINKYGAAKRGNDSLNRSKTFFGIAQAMSDQWGTEVI